MATDAWRNWRAFSEGADETENFDVEIHSDRHLLGGPSTHGPFTVTLIIGHPRNYEAPAVRPAAMLRIGLHARLLPEVVVDGNLARPDSTSYHGGGLDDEFAALLSLIWGIRLRVAGTARLSGIPDGDAVDGPVHLEVPRLSHPGRPGHEVIPAALRRTASLSELNRLDSYPLLDSAPQTSLARAARSYATGLWWANEDPNQAWLHFVTAVEIAASSRQEVRATPVELVRELWPELWSVIAPLDERARTDVAALLAPQVRAMLKSPICDADGAFQEIPGGLNSGGRGGIWAAKETPMLLSTFEFIVRGALLTWWDELIGAIPTAS